MTKHCPMESFSLLKKFSHETEGKLQIKHWQKPKVFTMWLALLLIMVYMIM